ncbi:hypothetical protein CGC20_11790 [Leishmania donovani]|uniref:Uncharacterized protein n=1 Tax=Leishmania donovani TaxID=5661 RepID=A0A504XFI4_LEIDO|nr:hypothetical protein CGC20_11790 [Leishmania donovani]
MPNTQQARTPTRNVRGDAPVRHWLLVGHRNVFADNALPPSRAQAAQPKSPSSSVSKSKKKQCGRSVKKATVESAAPFASSRVFSAGRYKDANEGEGNVSDIGTAYLISTPGRPSQSPDEDGRSAPCAPAVVAALQKTEACTPTRKEPRGQQHSAESSVVRPTSPLEHAEDGVCAVQTRDSSHVPAPERAALLSGSLLLSSAPSDEHAGDMAPSVGVIRYATTTPAASAKNAFGQQPGAGTAVNINDAGTACSLACVPETPHLPMQVRFFRSSKPRWQGARTPNETVIEAGNDGNGTDTHGERKNFIQSHARDRVPHEETGSCVTPPRTLHAVSTIATLQEKGEEGSGFGGKDGAVADACGCLNAPTTAVVVREQGQVNASLEHSPPPAVLPVLPRASAVLNATEELSNAAATTSFRSSGGSPIPPPIPPYPNNRKESTANATPLRHSDTADPALWQRGGPGDGDEGCMCVAGPHTPDVVREALPRRLQSASPSLQESVNAISSFFSPAGRPDSRKRVSPSSGRGPSSSYGFSDGGSTLESRQTRRLTPYCDTDEEDNSRGISASRNMTRPLEESTQEVEQLHHRLPAEDVVAAAGLPGACLSSTDSAVKPSATLLRCNDDLATLSSHVQAEEPVCPREVGWRSTLQLSHALLAEYQRSVLTAFMTACKAAWLPSMAVCRLGYVCTHAYASPRVAEQAPATGITVPEVHLLFQLYCTSPSESAADRLVECFFATQLVCYVNWVHHLQFEYLYVRMVALRAVSMMELHERRLICMRRDLAIRDAIELFMLLAPRPRAPMVSTGRRVFSAFRMALHALSGGGGGSNAGAAAASAKRRGSCSARTQHKPSSPATPRCATGCQLTADEERRQHRPPRVEPLFASEAWNAARATCDISAVTSPTNHGAGDSDVDAQNVVRKVASATNPPPEMPECHRGAPHLLCKTYSNDCGPVAERSSSGGVSSVLPVLWLPRLIRSTPRTASVAHKTRKETGMVAAKTDCSEVEGQGKDGFSRRSASSVLSSRSPNHRELGRRSSRDAALPHGGLRARETVQPKKRSRTPPPLPTDADFLNLRDAEVLKRFIK